MQLTPEQIVALMLPLNPNRVETRTQSGSTLSYLAAYDVKASLIRIFGFGGFDAEVIDSQVLRIDADIPKRDGGTTAWRVLAKCTVRLTIHDLAGARDAVYTETAAASQQGADIGEVTDFALKTAESDALKRAAIYLGTQFGLSLYKPLPGKKANTSDIVRMVFAPGQREEDVAHARANLRKKPVPGTPTEDGVPPTPTEDPVAKAAADIERATAAPRREAATA